MNSRRPHAKLFVLGFLTAFAPPAAAEPIRQLAGTAGNVVVTSDGQTATISFTSAGEVTSINLLPANPGIAVQFGAHELGIYAYAYPDQAPSVGLGGGGFRDLTLTDPAGAAVIRYSPENNTATGSQIILDAQSFFWGNSSSLDFGGLEQGDSIMSNIITLDFDEDVTDLLENGGTAAGTASFSLTLGPANGGVSAPEPHSLLVWSALAGVAAWLRARRRLA
ncbi:MAG TPA: hypothetical protein VNC50_03615 [Planctomycetia bacterium]|nr:hypothetical protein [Planctomycetia bacterium]